MKMSLSRASRHRGVLGGICFLLILCYIKFLIWNPSSSSTISVPSLESSSTELQPASSISDVSTEYGSPPLLAESRVSNAFAQHPCARVAETELAKLRTVERPSIFTFHHGVPLLSDDIINAPTDLCLIISVPQTSSLDEEFLDVPVENDGPDSIHLLLNTSASIITLPPLRPLPSQHSAQQLFSFQPILYYAETDIRFAGTYEIHAEIEWANWHWAQEWEAFLDQTPRVLRFRNGVETAFKEKSEAEAKDERKRDYVFDPKPILTEDMHPPTLRISPPIDGIHDSRPPPCSDTLTVAQGQWLRTDDPSADEWGYAWDSPTCIASTFTNLDIFSCLSGKTIHVYGDSMLRRWSKVLLSGGEWCHNLTHHCQSEDNREDEPVDILILNDRGELVETEGSAVQFSEETHEPFRFGDGSELRFHWVHSLALSPHIWVRHLYDEEDIIWNGVHRETTVKANAIARPPPEQSDADIVLLGFGAWDQAFAPNFDLFKNHLPAFRDSIMQAYAGKPVYLRLANSYCCRAGDVSWRRYSGARVQHFDDLVRSAFDVEGASAMGGRVKVVDPVNFGGRPEVYRDYG